MLQFDEYKVKLNNLLPQLDELEKALNLESAAREVDFLEAQSASDGFGITRELPAGSPETETAEKQAGIPGKAPCLLGGHDGFV